jgi:hypothetical protein
MSQQKPESIASVIATSPVYLFKYLLGMALGALTDVTITSLALGSLFLALATTPFVGLAVFFIMHTLIKMVNALSGAQVRQGNLVGNAIMRHAGVFAQQQSEPPSQPPANPVGEKAS